jgi:hypothetical protein
MSYLIKKSKLVRAEKRKLARGNFYTFTLTGVVAVVIVTSLFSAALLLLVKTAEKYLEEKLSIRTVKVIYPTKILKTYATINTLDKI